jgi:hypothetical protein
MAQIIWAVTGSNPKGPQFFLLNANGPTMLRRAVRFAIEQNVDIILFSASFEGGGNGDGRGSINRIVSEALSEGIIWINAAGNYGRRVFKRAGEHQSGRLPAIPDWQRQYRASVSQSSRRKCRDDHSDLE